GISPNNSRKKLGLFWIIPRNDLRLCMFMTNVFMANDIPTPEKVVVEVPQAVFNDIIDGLKKIDHMERALKEFKVVPQDEWLTPDEFLGKIKMKRWKFNTLKDAGVLNLRKIGKKWFINAKDVDR